MIKRIPRMFYQDHLERALPAPPAVKENSRSVWIETDHPDMSELLDDARFYTEAVLDPDYIKYAQAAQRMLDALS